MYIYYIISYTPTFIVIWFWVCLTMADHHKLVILIGVIGKIWEDDDNMLDRFLFGRCHGELLSGNQPWLENPPFIEDSSIKPPFMRYFPLLRLITGGYQTSSTADSWWCSLWRTRFDRITIKSVYLILPFQKHAHQVDLTLSYTLF